MNTDVNQMKSLTLAYMGDAVYEVYIRRHLLNMGEVKPKQLHEQAVTYVSANAQASVVLSWLENGLLTEDEQKVVTRGRNAKSGSAPKNTNVQTYRYSTAFETLIGYLYLLEKHNRLHELITHAIGFLEKGRASDA